MDITSDNSNTLKSIDEISSRFDDLYAMMKKRDFGVGFAEQLDSINKAVDSSVKDIEGKVKDLQRTIDDLIRRRNQATASGNGNEAGALQSQIDGLVKERTELLKNLSQYQSYKEEIKKAKEAAVSFLDKQERQEAVMARLGAVIKGGAVSGMKGLIAVTKTFLSIGLVGAVNAIAMAFSAFMKYLKGSEEGQLAVARVSGYLSGLFTSLKGAAASVGRALFDAFKTVQPVVETVTTRIAGLVSSVWALVKIGSSALKGDWDAVKGDWEAFKEGLKTMWTGELAEGGAAADIKEQAKETSKLYAEREKLRIQQKKWGEERAEIELKIAKAEARGDQAEANALNKRIREREIGLLKQEYDIEKKLVDLKGEGATAADQDRLRELRTGILNAQAEGIKAGGVIAKEAEETVAESIERRLKEIYSSVRSSSLAQAFEDMMSANPMLRKYHNEPIEIDEIEDEESVADMLARKLAEAKSRAESVADSFIDMGQALEGVDGTIGEIGVALGSVGSAARHVIDILHKEKEGDEFDMISSVSSLVSGVVQLGAMVGTQIKEDKEEQEEWNRVIADSVHEFTMLNLESLDYKQRNIFGVENPYKKAIDGAVQYGEAMAKLQEQSAKLAGGKVQTGTRKGINWANVGKGAAIGASAGAVAGAGIFSGLTAAAGAAIGAGAGIITGLLSRKVVPVFENLTDKYGTIVNEDFTLNPQLLADYDKLDDDTKKLVDNWQDIKAKAEEAEAQMHETFTNLSGDIGAQLSDSLVEAFMNGRLDSAIDSFHDKMTGTIEDIVEQMVFANIFSEMFDQLEKDMDASFGAGGDNNIVDDLMKFEEAYQSGLEEYGAQMDAAREYLQSKGYDAWGGSSNVEASSRGFAAMSQDTASELNGRFTALQISNETIAQGMTTAVTTLLAMQSLVSEGGSALSDIRDMHILEAGYLADIAKQTKPIPGMVEMIDKIERNTSRL